ncbi:MAG: sigma-70 family RNA polymerase sigma factor [Acidobacteria bacterium]|nr:sigma-70 family RNA polymerase sigma factor [Acidobacteriota bacterium]
MNLNECPSNDYLAKLASADPATTDHFVRHYTNILQVKLRARTIYGHEAEEIRQETFRRVLSAVKEGKIRDGTKLNAYVNSTCNHVISEHFRHTSRLLPLDASASWQSTDNTEDAVLLAEKLERIRKVLDKMSVRDREILNAVFLEERDKDAVCLQLGVNRDYLRVLVHRAINSFRQEFLQ